MHKKWETIPKNMDTTVLLYFIIITCEIETLFGTLSYDFNEEH